MRPLHLLIVLFFLLGCLGAGIAAGSAAIMSSVVQEPHAARPEHPTVEPKPAEPVPPTQEPTVPAPPAPPAAPPAPPAAPPAPPAAPPAPPAAPPTPSADAPRPIYHLDRDRPEVVLTFDDGPSSLTPAILSILKAEQVPAAFFWLTKGKLTLAPEVLAQGHQLGTHSISHTKLTMVDEAAQRNEISGSRQALEQAGQAPVQFFRPPYGTYNPAILAIAREESLATILWDVDSRDWEAKTADEIIAKVMKHVRPGSIILLHERKLTVEALPALIQSLKAAGYSFRLLPAESDT